MISWIGSDRSEYEGNTGDIPLWMWKGKHPSIKATYSFPKYAFGRSVSKNGQPFFHCSKICFKCLPHETVDQHLCQTFSDHESNCSCDFLIIYAGFEKSGSFESASSWGQPPTFHHEVWRLNSICHTFKNKDSRPLTIPQQWLNFNLIKNLWTHEFQNRKLWKFKSNK